MLAALFLAWAIALFVRCRARRGVFGIVCCACLSVVWALIVLLFVIVLLKSLKVFVPDGHALIVFGAKIPYLGRLVALFGYPVTYVQLGAAVALGLVAFAVYGVRGAGEPAVEPAPLTDGEDFEIERPGIDDAKYAPPQPEDPADAEELPQPEMIPEAYEPPESVPTPAAQSAFDATESEASEETFLPEASETTEYEDTDGGADDVGYDEADAAYYADEASDDAFTDAYDEQLSDDGYDAPADEYFDEPADTEQAGYDEPQAYDEAAPEDYAAEQMPAPPQSRPHKRIEPARPSDRSAVDEQLTQTVPADAKMPTGVRTVIRNKKQPSPSAPAAPQQKAAPAPQPTHAQSEKPAAEKKANERKQQPNHGADHAVKHVEPVMKEDLPITRRHVILNRTNIANMFNEYLSTRSDADKEKLENSISTIIVK